MPSSLVEAIYPIFASHKKTSIILHIISYNLICFYYKSVWLPRCALFNSWLKQNQIDLKNKTANRLYPINQPALTPSRPPINSIPINSHLILINDFIKTGTDFLLPR